MKRAGNPLPFVFVCPSQKMNKNFFDKNIRFIFFIFIIFGAWLLGRFFNIDIEQYRSALSPYPLFLSGIVFIGIYVITTTLIWFGPKDILRLVAAIFYGPFYSTVFVWLAELLNACIMFHLSRFLGREFIEQKFKAASRDIERAKSNSSVIGISALRLNPLIPLRFLDLGYGLTQVSFFKYFCVILITSFPRILWSQSILSQVGDAIFKDYNLVLEYFLNHPFIMYYSGVYFMVVVFLSAWAFFIKLRRNS